MLGSWKEGSGRLQVKPCSTHSIPILCHQAGDNTIHACRRTPWHHPPSQSPPRLASPSPSCARVQQEISGSRTSAQGWDTGTLPAVPHCLIPDNGLTGQPSPHSSIFRLFSILDETLSSVASLPPLPSAPRAAEHGPGLLLPPQISARCDTLNFFLGFKVGKQDFYGNSPGAGSMKRN